MFGPIKSLFVMFNRKTLTLFAATVIAGLVVAGSANAAVIQVDFNGAATDPDSTWNVIEAPSSVTGLSLLDTTGADSGIDLTIVNDSSGIFSDSSSTGQDGAFAGTDFEAAANDYFFGTTSTSSEGATGSIVLSNVAAGVYKFELVASRTVAGTSGSRVGDYSVNGSFGDSTPNGDDFDAYNDGAVDGSLMVWNSVTPDAGNKITLQVTIGPGKSAFTNAFRMTLVPEPASALLAGLGVLGLLCLRRRK